MTLGHETWPNKFVRTVRTHVHHHTAIYSAEILCGSAATAFRMTSATMIVRVLTVTDLIMETAHDIELKYMYAFWAPMHRV